MRTTTALFWLSAAFFYTLRGFPLSDDGSFATGLEQLRQGTTITSDYLWLANLAIAWIGLLAFYKTMRRLGSISSPARAGALTLMANPLFFVLSYLRTPDIAVLTLMLLAGHCYVAGVQEGRSRWSLAGSLLVTVACFFRPLVGCMTLGFVLWMLARDLSGLAARSPKERAFSYAAVLVAPVLVGISWKIWAHASLASFLPNAVQIQYLPVRLLERCGGAVLYLGAFLIPWAFSHEPLRKGAWVPSVLLLGLWAALGLAGLRPAVGGLIGHFGLGLCPWGEQCSYLTVGMLQQRWFWIVVTGLSAFSALLLAWRLGTAREFMASAWGGYGMGFLLAFLVLMFTRDFNDRHYLFLFPPVIVLAAGNLKFRWGDFAPLLGLIGAFAFLGTWNCLSWNRARTEAGETLHAMNIPYADISNGEDWNFYYGKDKAGRNGPARYAAFTTLYGKPAPKGTHLVGQTSYWSPLNFRTNYLYLWRRWK